MTNKSINKMFHLDTNKAYLAFIQVFFILIEWNFKEEKKSKHAEDPPPPIKRGFESGLFNYSQLPPDNNFHHIFSY